LNFDCSVRYERSQMFVVVVELLCETNVVE
jgi:hypothetical protein